MEKGAERCVCVGGGGVGEVEDMFVQVNVALGYEMCCN